MFEKIVDIEARDNYHLMAVFENGAIREYDARPLLETQAFAPLKEQLERFYAVKPICCGSAVAWEGSVDLASEEIWENGRVMDSR